MRVRKELITPKKAAEWLEKYNTKNRSLRKHKVDAYVAAMQAGQWIECGDTIRFDKDGILIDGQHRLAAIVKTGMSFNYLVVRDLDRASWDPTDTHKPRSLGDAFTAAGELNCNSLAAVTRLVWRIERGFTRSNRSIKFYEGFDMLTRHPGLRKATTFSSQTRYKPAHARLAPPSVVGALYYVFSVASCCGVEPDAELAEVFWDRTLLGEGLTKDMAEYWLRARLIENKTGKAKLPDDVITHLCAKAWTYCITGRECRSLQLRAGEEFPAFTFPS